MVPAALRRLGTLGLIALWVLVSGGLLLLLALSVQNSMQFSRLQAWILLANVIALIAVSVLLARKIIELVRAFRAAGPGFAPDGAHGRHLRLAGRRAAHHRLSILARVPEPRHRQLVQGRDQAGPHRRARSVQVGDGRAHARVRAQHAVVRQPARRQPARQLGGGHRRAARRERRARGRRVRNARPGARGQQRRRHFHHPAARVAGDHQRHRGRQRLLEPGAAVGRRLPDQHGRAYRDRPGCEPRSIRGGAVPGAAATRRASRKPCSIPIRSTATSPSSARA